MKTIEDIKKLSITEIKALLFDENMAIENIRKNIEVLSKILNEKLKETQTKEAKQSE